MERPRSTGNRIDLKPHEFVLKVARGQVVTTVIDQNRLAFYLKAASATGFRVEKIADEGEEFPSTYKTIYIGPVDSNGLPVQLDGKPYVESLPNEAYRFSVRSKGCIAVSIERPEDGNLRDGHRPFWKELKRLEQEKDPSSSIPASKS